MKRADIHIALPFMLALACSCEEVYNPGSLRIKDRIPVIHGSIEEGGFPQVSLSWALNYNDEQQEFINDGRVYITDNLNDTSWLLETSSGNYTTLSESSRGQRGKTYILHVNLPDGSNFISTPEYIHERPQIDSLFATIQYKSTGTKPLNTTSNFREQNGLTIFVNLSSTSDSALFYRFDTHYIKQMSYTIDYRTPQEYSVFSWNRDQLDYSYSSGFSVAANGRQVLRDHNIGFLPYYFDDTNANDSITGTYIDSWDLTCKVYSISREVYSYYSSIEKQLNARLAIFAPTPAQIFSNIKCVNKQNQIVVGVFETVSRSTTYKAFAWNTIFSYKSKLTDSIPEDLTSGSMERFIPSWWILF